MVEQDILESGPTFCFIEIYSAIRIIFGIKQKLYIAICVALYLVWERFCFVPYPGHYFFMTDELSGLRRRMAAIFYDILCLLGIFFLVTMVVVLLGNGIAIDSDNIVYDLYLLLVAYLYFVWHWVNGGQTIGMRAWRIRLKKQDARRLSWFNATVRFFLGSLSCIFGIGFLWACFDSKKLTFHDRYSGTRLVKVE